MGQVQNTYAVPAAGAAAVIIRCTRVSSRMTIKESVATNALVQGLAYNLLYPQGFGRNLVGPLVVVPPDFEPEDILIAGYPGDHPPNTVPIGNGGSGGQPVGPGGPATLGTAIAQVTSASATPTEIVVTEWY
jgi:hypothetical protein